VDWIPAGAKGPKADFTGFLNVPRDGLYTFTLSAPANCRLWIDETPVIVNDTGKTADHQALAALAAGRHAIKVHYENWGETVPLKLSWQGPGLEAQEVPAEAFSHAKQAQAESRPQAAD
jgi:hypothetical protein